MNKQTAIFFSILFLGSFPLKPVVAGGFNDYLVGNALVTEAHKSEEEEMRERAQWSYDAWKQRRAEFQESSVNDRKREAKQILQRDRERSQLEEARLKDRGEGEQQFWQPQMRAREQERGEEIKAKRERGLKLDKDLSQLENQEQDDDLVSETDPFNSQDFWDQQEQDKKNSKRRATSVQIKMRKYGPHAPPSKE
ncbi:MAG: hypothetical protein ACSNEK_04660 [Parachlamydiaceae bacterium]